MVGTRIGESGWYDITQERINAFAEPTEDRQFIHIDPEAARDGPFGQTIAHGFLTLSLLPAMLDNSTVPAIRDRKTLINYGCNKLRFLTPVKSGKRVRGVFTLLELIEKRPGQWQETLEFTVEIEGEDKPALIAEWVLQFLV